MKRTVLQGKVFRWVVPDLDDFITLHHSLCLLEYHLPRDKEQLKDKVLSRLLASKTAHKGLQYYKLAIETHPSTGKYHLDLLLTFKSQIRVKTTQLDFLLMKHGDLTRYRNLSKGIIDYADKEDEPLTNILSTIDVLLHRQLREDPFLLLKKEMVREPLTFNLGEYVAKNHLMQHIRNWSSVKNKLHDAQEYYANILLVQKPGIRSIDRMFITERLTPEELHVYDSWSGYSRIVSYINEITQYGCHRPFKSLNPLLIGPPNIGKTSLALELERHMAVYPKGVSNWFPSYRSNVYPLILWDQFTLSGMKYPELLKFLQGSPLDLEFKGGSTMKRDNQLILMTSNLSLNYHIQAKFGYDLELYKLSRVNLAVRIDEIIVPEGLTLFLLQKLIVEYVSSDSVYI